MTEKKKRIVLVAAVVGIVSASILTMSLMNKKPQQPTVSSKAETVSSSLNSNSNGGFFNAQSTTSRTTSSTDSSDHTTALLEDAQKVLHLRYDLSDTSISTNVLKQSLRDYMTDKALNEMFSSASVPQVKASAASSPALSSAAPKTSSSQKPSNSSASATSKPAISSSQHSVSSSDPEVTYRPISTMDSCIVTQMANYKPIEKVYSYATEQRMYSHDLDDKKQNVLIYYTLSVVGDNLPSNTSNCVMSLNMEYNKSAGHWIVSNMELDAKVDYSLAPFQK